MNVKRLSDVLAHVSFGFVPNSRVFLFFAANNPRARTRISTIVTVFCLHTFTALRKPLIAKGLQVKAKPKFAFTNTRFGEGSEGKKHNI